MKITKTWKESYNLEMDNNEMASIKEALNYYLAVSINNTVFVSADVVKNISAVSMMIDDKDKI